MTYFQAVQLNLDEGRNDRVFNDATGEFCIASSPDRTSTVATSTDTTLLLYLQLLCIHAQSPVPFMRLIHSSLTLSDVFSLLLGFYD